MIYAKDLTKFDLDRLLDRVETNGYPCFILIMYSVKVVAECWGAKAQKYDDKEKVIQ